MQRVYTQDRSRLRQMFYQAWTKFQAGEPQEPLERLIAEIVKFHPEYHGALADPERGLDRDYAPEAEQTNPFLHMAMHIAIQEQLGSGRPAGFRELYRGFVGRYRDPHQAEHRIMECLGETLWQAQRGGTMPDEQAYLACLRELLLSGKEK